MEKDFPSADSDFMSEIQQGENFLFFQLYILGETN